MALDYSELTKRYKSSQSALEESYNQMVPMWTDIRNFIAPRTARFRGEQVNSGQRQDLNMINTSPRSAVRTLAAGLQSGVTSPIRPWFKLGFADLELSEFGPVKTWLYIVQQRMLEVFARSNLYDRLKSNYAILGSYGTSALVLDEDPTSIIRAYDLPMGSFLLGTSPENRCNVLYRDVSYNAVQMVDKFAPIVGMKNLPQGVQNAYDKGNYSYMYPICHIIEPNRDYKPSSQLSENKRYASVYFDPAQTDKKAILSYKGYDDQPFMAPRWDVVGEDTWGFGCGEAALGDGKQTQLMEKRKLQGIDKNVHPTMVADASLRNQRTTSLPGETTYVSGLITGNQGYRPAYQVNPYINELREEIAAVTGRIDDAFYKNLFLMVTEMADQPNITATQINALREEKLLGLSPVLERLNEELLNPLITRTFYIMQRNGMIPPPPKEIQGMPIKVEYISVLAQAQKAMGIGNIERFTGFVAKLALDSQDPSVWDKVDKDQMIDEYGEGVAVPPTIIRPDDVVAGIRAKRDQKQSMMEQSALASQGADAAKKLSDADMSSDNALTRALGVTGAI